MRQVFADAVYWVALVHRKDQWHSRAVMAALALKSTTIVTTEEIFDEFLTYFSERGPTFRLIVVRAVEDALCDPSLIVKPQSHQSFIDGLSFYKARPQQRLQPHRLHFDGDDAAGRYHGSSDARPAFHPRRVHRSPLISPAVKHAGIRRQTEDGLAHRQRGSVLDRGTPS
jgi:hypothetical protein